ncbi:MAG: hypothetical protein MK116_10265 [Phycisphaerales bacterium]|nr:hypothetical protein [Phycisphaerales bacterium]
MRLSLLLGILATTAVSSTASAEIYSAVYGQPDFDRWMYPYNATPGDRIVGPTFTGYLSGDIEDRYGQTMLGWVTIDIPPDLPPSSYRVVSMSVDVTIANADVYLDNTADDRASHEPGGIDEDPGRPFHLSGAGFRNDYDANSFGEDGPHPFGAGLGGRNAYALGFDEDGNPIDISNNLTEQFDPKLFAIGDSDDAEPGEFLPELSTVNFVVDVDDPDIACYLAQGLSFGTLDVMLSSFHSGSQDGSGSYPNWMLKEHSLVDIGVASAATLTLEVEVIEPSGVPADATGDGAVNVDDLLAVLGDYGRCPCCPTDFDESGTVDVDEVLFVIANWTG